MKTKGEVIADVWKALVLLLFFTPALALYSLSLGSAMCWQALREGWEDFGKRS